MKRSRTPDDQELVSLITRAKAGDDAAHRELYTRFKKPSIQRIERAFSTLDPQKIEEAFDEAYMAAVSSYDAFAKNASFKNFLGLALRNRCIDKARRGTLDRATQSIDTPDIHLVITGGDALSYEEALPGWRVLEEWVRPILGSYFQEFISHYMYGVKWKELGPDGTRVEVHRRIKRAIERGEADEVLDQLCAFWCRKACRFAPCRNPIRIS